MLQPGDRVGVAVSGGADSVTLLHALHRLVSWSLFVLHVNHELRGAESDQDEQFVRDLATDLSLPCHVKRAKPGEGNMEQLAREARRTFFAECCGALKLRAVALGHNQTDQAETVLYRFLRGSGISGLSGMSPVTADHLIRPMLDLTREEIREWAREKGITWREDSTNQNTDLIRNRLRLEMINPRLVKVLSATAGVARDEEDWWAGQAERLYSETARKTDLGILFAVPEVGKLHPAEQRRLLRYSIRMMKGDLRSIDLAHVEAVRRLLETDLSHDRTLIPGVDAIRSFSTLLLTQPGRLASEIRHYCENIKINDEVALPFGGARLSVRRVKPEPHFCANFGLSPHTIEEISDLDGEALDRLGTPDLIYVRNWEPGDEFQRVGHTKPEKIKKLFQEHRILLWDRRRWPVLVLGNKIVWSRQFGAAAQFEATSASCNIVRVHFRAGSASTPIESKGME